MYVWLWSEATFIMRILLLTHSFNCLTQRLMAELIDDGHQVSVEFDINDEITKEAVDLFQPQLIIAPYLKSIIPKDIWTRFVCLIVHPGIVGDKGPSSLDWAIMKGEKEWGVTIIQANDEVDGGDIWASEVFKLREAAKSSVYRNEVTQSTLKAIKKCMVRFKDKNFSPTPLNNLLNSLPQESKGCFRSVMQQKDRVIDWLNDATKLILRKIWASDSFPGVLDIINNQSVYLYGASEAKNINYSGSAGNIVSRKGSSVCIATKDGAIWISHLRKRKEGVKKYFKLPASMVLNDWERIPEVTISEVTKSEATSREKNDVQFFKNNKANDQFFVRDKVLAESWLGDGIKYQEDKEVGYLYFDFLNGAMSTSQCNDLLDSYRYAVSRPTKVIVLMGGHDFWSNGINLNTIENAPSPSQESWLNINALNDLVLEVINTSSHYTIAAMQGNSAAGGVFFALATDCVWGRSSIILNPHYKNMGNLYGSEYWTYLLPQKVKSENFSEVLNLRLPITAKKAKQLGLLDDCFENDVFGFGQKVKQRAKDIACSSNLFDKLRAKSLNRKLDEEQKPLSEYRKDEMEQMQLNFFGCDPSYHVARYNFVHKVPLSRTPLYLARHRKITLIQ